MKKTLVLILLYSFFTMEGDSQNFNELINLQRYEVANSELVKSTPKEKRIVLLGNSITQGWAHQRPEFFEKHNFVGRGIGGQTSPQLLSRFRADVVDLKPIAVVINIGTNDIAENTGKYDSEFTLGNIKSMADIAVSNKIQVILSSVLPAAGFSWNKEITDSVEKIEALNKEIEAYALKNNFIYIDYYTHLKDENGALKSHFGDDGVHPNGECYELMESILLNAISYGK